MIQFLKKLLLLLFTMQISSCSKNTDAIMSGDLVFRSTSAGGISDAINSVTKNSQQISYSHMGICIVENNNIWVYHAAPAKGVCKELLEDFCRPDTAFTYTTDLYRLDISIQSLKEIKTKLDNYLGQPYDSTYIINNEGYYCSEFIYDVFKNNEIFKLNTMTFKDPLTGLFHDGWIEHYKNLGIEIPEGQPGCNPNDMSKNKKLKFITRLN